MLTKLNNYIITLFLRLKGLDVKHNVHFESIPKVVLHKDSHIIIGSNTVVRKGVELRSVGKSILDIGDEVKLDNNVRIISCNNSTIKIGNKTRIGLGTVFNGGESIIIGDSTLISGYVYLQSSMHKYRKNSDLVSNGYEYGKIELGRNCWLGVHAVIFPNVKLGNNCIVGSNCVVNSSYGDNSIIAGVPSKFIKSI